MTEPYLLDWLSLILRFVHLITGIAWIGASFYFIWLDNHLQTPPDWKQAKGIKGDLWAIHGGGFYEVAKYQLAPQTLPTTLHWFKWEAYSTWISGFLLLTLLYYVGAGTYLIDPSVNVLSQPMAITIGLFVIFGGWLLYDTLCRSRLAGHSLMLGLVLLVLLAAISFGLSKLFSARGAYMHVGAMIGTLMVANVFRVIIPAQQALVAAVTRGESPDPAWAAAAKLRSTHNTYATLPVLFIMISSHYPMTYGHPFSYLVLLAMVILTAAARHYFVLRHTNRQHLAWLAGPALGTLLLAWVMMPTPATESGAGTNVITSQDAMVIITTRCATCHSHAPSDDVFTVAPGGVVFDNLPEVLRWSERILARTLLSTDMPLLNKTRMTDIERQQLRDWLVRQNPVETQPGL